MISTCLETMTGLEYYNTGKKTIQGLITFFWSYFKYIYYFSETQHSRAESMSQHSWWGQHITCYSTWLTYTSYVLFRAHEVTHLLHLCPRSTTNLHFNFTSTFASRHLPVYSRRVYRVKRQSYSSAKSRLGNYSLQPECVQTEPQHDTITHTHKNTQINSATTEAGVNGQACNRSDYKRICWHIKNPMRNYNVRPRADKESRNYMSGADRRETAACLSQSARSSKETKILSEFSAWKHVLWGSNFEDAANGLLEIYLLPHALSYLQCECVQTD